MLHNPPTQAFGPTVNRVSDLMAHSSRYAFKGVTRLAEDARVSPSSISRLLSDNPNPSFVMVARLTAALEERFGFRIDPRDIFAENGKFLTPHICSLVGCAGCLPDNALDEFGDTKPMFQGISPGTWVASRYPRGFMAGKGAL